MNGKILEGRSVGLNFSCEYPLTNLPVSIPRNGDSSPTITSVKLNGFWFSLDSLGRSNLDTPICIYVKDWQRSFTWVLNKIESSIHVL